MPATAATRPWTTTWRTATRPRSAMTFVLIFSTAAFTASPMIVLWKLLLPKFTLPAPKPPQPPPPPVNEVPMRLDRLQDLRRRQGFQPVSTLTTRAVRPTIALLSLTLTPPRPNRPRPAPTPLTPVFFVSFPNCVTLPTMMASTPSSLPIFAAEEESARSLLEKFCSARILSRMRALDHRVAAVLDEVRDEEVGDPLPDVDVVAEDGRRRCCKPWRNRNRGPRHGRAPGGERYRRRSARPAAWGRITHRSRRGKLIARISS